MDESTNRLPPSPIQIEALDPFLDHGRYLPKACAGDVISVEADIYSSRIDVLRAVIRWTRKEDGKSMESSMIPLGNDRWRGEFPVKDPGAYVFTVEAWSDSFATWLNEFKEKVTAGQEIHLVWNEGKSMLKAMLAQATSKDKAFITTLTKAVEDKLSKPLEALDLLMSTTLFEIVHRLQVRKESKVHEPAIELNVLPLPARFGAWYEMFARSQGTDPSKSGTFDDVLRRLPDIKQMGFDILYLAPIHPIGITARKGRNDSLQAKISDPGCPWAVGNELGGHTAVDPSLGTIADFDNLVKQARAMGLEIALDFAIQCSPDHPWVKQHPNWFYRRSDGSIKCAENPPMKYEDIIPLNFETEDWGALWNALRDVVLFWVGHGVKIFRVDNPHTKPLAFWEWLINEVTAQAPEVVFLAEAFTKPKMMKALSKVGFTQSYTYFTWRTNRYELIEYLQELTKTDMRHYFFPNFFVTTHDVLPYQLQNVGAPAFKMRLLLAATSSPSYGIYNGYELCESEAKPGSEEYLNSEKFEIKPRDWNRAGNIKDFIARVNRIRHENPAFQALDNLDILHCPNTQILSFIKSTRDKSNVIIIVINLDPFNIQEGTISIAWDKIGLPPGQPYEVQDLLNDQTFTWNEHNFVKLDPRQQTGHILKVSKRT